MFRREWREQALILTLLAAAVAAAIGFSALGYATTTVADNAVFGTANHFLRLSNDDADALATDVAAGRDWFDNAEVIYHRPVPIPGVFEPVDYRAQEPDGRLGGGRLALVDGSYPTGTDVAITDGLADLLDLDIGASLALDGKTRSVVGIVENPGDLDEDFVLVAPSELDGADQVTILVDATEDRVNSFHPPNAGDLEAGSRLGNDNVLAAVGTLVIATIGLLLIALIAAASFVVIAHRRMRQLGMLAAMGATEKQLRYATLTNGAMIGSVAAAVGAALGFGGWLALAPRVETAVGYRVDASAVPPWVIASGMLLAIIAGTAAAWWPARSVSRVPTVRALSGRPPEPKPARRAAALALVFAAIGAACLAMGGDVTSVGVADSVLIVAGIVSVSLAVLFACPPAIRVLAAGISRFPVAVRLAIGDLARYRARAGAALASISLILGIAVTIIATATAAQATADEGNLPDNTVLIRAGHVDGPFVPTVDELGALQASVDRVVASFDTPEVTSLEVAIEPESEPDPSFEGRIAASLAERISDGWADVSLLYVATPELLARYGYDLNAAPSAAVLTAATGDLAILGDVADGRSNVEPLIDAVHLEPGYESLPATFVTAGYTEAHGWVTAPSGRWLVELNTPPTSDQIADAREAAAGAGLTVEVRDRQGGVAALRNGATAAGTLVALGVVAMTVGLVRGEAGRDLRILTATGATTRTRRTLTAATAGGLAVLGVVLGIGAAYLGLAAGFVRDLDALFPLPLLNLAAIAIGLPILAMAAGWLVAGRDVGDIARQPIE